MVGIHHDTRFAVNAHQVALVRRHQHAILRLAERRDAKLLRKISHTIAEIQLLHLLSLGVIDVETIVVGLDPEGLLRVDMQLFNTALDALLSQPDGRCAVYLLRDGIVDRVGHAMIQPQLAVVGLEHAVYAIAAQCHGVTLVGIIVTESVTVVAAQSEGRAYPYQSVRVAQHTVHLGIRHTVSCVQMTEFHIGDTRPKHGRHRDNQ